MENSGILNIASDESWSQVGFGWTSTYLGTSKQKVNLLTSSPEWISFDSYETQFPGSKPFETVHELIPDYPISNNLFQETILYVLETYFQENLTLQSDLVDFQSHGTSCQRRLRWEIMHIPKHMSFPLHAHPNIEVICVLQGEIHEYRMIGSPFKRSFQPQETMGPSFVDDQINRQFDHKVHPAIDLSKSIDLTKEEFAKSFLVNEVGSIHLTFTKEQVILSTIFLELSQYLFFLLFHFSLGCYLTLSMVWWSC